MVASVLCNKDLWEKDADVKHCRRCSKAFGTFTRKSHCRLCGRIFCGDCVHSVDVDVFAGEGGKQQPLRETVKGCQTCIVRYRMSLAIPKNRPAERPAAATAPIIDAEKTNSALSAANMDDNHHENAHQNEAVTEHINSATNPDGADDGIFLSDDEEAETETSQAPSHSAAPASQEASETDAKGRSLHSYHPEEKSTSSATKHSQNPDASAAASSSSQSRERTETSPSTADPAVPGNSSHSNGGTSVAMDAPLPPCESCDPIDEEIGDDWETYEEDIIEADSDRKHGGAAQASASEFSSTFEATGGLRAEASVLFDFCLHCGCIQKRCECPTAVATAPPPSSSSQPKTPASPAASQPPPNNAQSSRGATSRGEETPETIAAPRTASSAAPHATHVAAAEAEAPHAKHKKDVGGAAHVRSEQRAAVSQPVSESSRPAPQSDRVTEASKPDASTTPTTTTNSSSTETPQQQESANSEKVATVSSTTPSSPLAEQDVASRQNVTDKEPRSSSSHRDPCTLSTTTTTTDRKTPASHTNATASPNSAFQELDFESARIAAKCSRFLKAGEHIVKIQTVKKTRYMISHDRVLVLTDLPRLFYVDEGNVLKGSLVLDPRTTRIVSTGPKQFIVKIEGGKEYNFTTSETDHADRWVNTLQTSLVPH
jgi:hypothetical protein